MPYIRVQIDYTQHDTSSSSIRICVIKLPMPQGIFTFLSSSHVSCLSVFLPSPFSLSLSMSLYVSLCLSLSLSLSFSIYLSFCASLSLSFSLPSVPLCLSLTFSFSLSFSLLPVVSKIALDLTGSMIVPYQGVPIDLSPPWRRVPMHTLVQEKCGTYSRNL